MPKVKVLDLTSKEIGEVELIDPVAVPRLSRTDMVIECHPTDRLSIDEVVSLFTMRFETTHDIEVINEESASPEEWSKKHPLLNRIDPSQLAFGINEFRYFRQNWLWMRSRCNTDG